MTYFQADTDDLYRRWITSLQQGISSALHETITKDTSSASSDPSKLQWEDSDNEEEKGKKQRGVKPNAKQILRIPGNENCCDCGIVLSSSIHDFRYCSDALYFCR